MYVCNCNGISEHDLRKVAERACSSAVSAYAALGKRPNCGKCMPEAEALLRACCGAGESVPSA